MGCFCDSGKKEGKTNINTQHSNFQPLEEVNPPYIPSSKKYNTSKIPDWKGSSPNNQRFELINPHNIYSPDDKTLSYGLSNKNTRAPTVFKKSFIPDNNLKQMIKYYSNIFTIKKMAPKTIGEGGQAKIIKFYSEKYKKYLVKKVIKISLNPTASIKQSEILNKINLCKEAILLFRCDYPNVVKIYDFIDNPITIIMEYCAKGSLRKILDKNIYLPPIYKIFLIRSICDGLGYIHYEGIIHGDLKCDNILLSDEYRYYIGKKYYPIPKLADFGLAQINSNHLFAGTPGYIAPEVYKGSGLTKKTDIFSLGMVMFEILSGLMPLPSDFELAMKCLAAKIPPCTKEVLRLAWEERDELFLPGIKNAYYDAFYTIMIKCIDDDPDKRPDILSLFKVVDSLYRILVKESKEKIYDESQVEKLKKFI